MRENFPFLRIFGSIVVWKSSRVFVFFLFFFWNQGLNLDIIKIEQYIWSLMMYSMLQILWKILKLMILFFSFFPYLLIFVTMQIKTQSEPIWNKESVKTRAKRRIELVLLPGLITFVPLSFDKANDKESAFDTISYLERQIWEKRGEDEFCSTTRGQGNKEERRKREWRWKEGE